MSIKDVAKTVGNFGLGVAKGAGDTLMSVKRNVQKPIVEYTKLKVQQDLNKARESINAANEPLLKKLKETPKNDPKHAKILELLKSNNEAYANINKQEEEIMAEIDGVSTGQSTINPTDSWAQKLAKKAQNALNTGDKALQTTNAAQSAGFKVEKIAELLVPAGATAKADKALKGFELVKDAGTAGKVLNAVTRTAARAGVEAAATGAASLGQSAYQGRLDTKEGAKSALKDAGTAAATAGVIKGVLAGGGEALNALKVPQKLYNTVYKSTPKEEKMLFSHLVDGTDDAAKTVSGSDQTLADWALEKNIRGGIKGQAKQVMNMINQNEKNLIGAAEAQNVRLVVDPDLVKYAEGLKAEYASSPYKQVKTGIDSFLGSIDDQGSASVSDTLSFKRMLDSLRSKASFRNPKIGDDLIGWSDTLRRQINDIPVLGNINKDYAMSLAARDALIKKAVSENNKQLIGALEAYTVALPAVENAGTEGAKGLIGLATVAAKRVANSPRFQAGAAQAIKNLPNSSAFGVGSRALIGQGVNSVRNSMGGTESDLGFDPLGANQETPTGAAPAAPAANLTKDDLDLGFTPIQ